MRFNGGGDGARCVVDRISCAYILLGGEGQLVWYIVGVYDG